MARLSGLSAEQLLPVLAEEALCSLSFVSVWLPVGSVRQRSLKLRHTSRLRLAFAGARLHPVLHARTPAPRGEVHLEATLARFETSK